MKRHLLLAVLFAVAFPFLANAQFEKLKDSVIQLYGVVMTADSLKALPSVSVVVKSDGRGTQTNEQGVFSIVVQKGDKVEFTIIGYKPKIAEIPRDLEGNHYSLIQLMVMDAQFLPVTIIKPRPTKEQFERDFVNVPVPDDDLETARKNNDETKRRVIARTLPRDGQENSNMMLNNTSRSYYYRGQAPPQNIFNPFAWGEFIKAWKRGDFKNKN
ncbi:carboxypeptidase-like regulatory domain-containing protein [Paraflavitalea pollutisoli]|uniref:carboxypeptidase-like regulatory domain-containing protein n=1 Tax=Paraflavitalea pollutisoli TaxID=3034143 RepID=UPI0023ED5E8D|nr:carboxypeptidase-like regulatory domain-containing protein [Paraflavitalea sp. H1-2-19X]